MASRAVQWLKTSSVFAVPYNYISYMFWMAALAANGCFAKNVLKTIKSNAIGGVKGSAMAVLTPGHVTENKFRLWGPLQLNLLHVLDGSNEFFAKIAIKTIKTNSIAGVKSAMPVLMLPRVSRKNFPLCGPLLLHILHIFGLQPWLKLVFRKSL